MFPEPGLAPGFAFLEILIFLGERGAAGLSHGSPAAFPLSRAFRLANRPVPIMPMKVPCPCSTPGCGVLTRARYCSKHEQLATATKDKIIDARRGSSRARGYDRAWEKVRARQLHDHPLCQCDECKEGELRVTPAEVVDHRIPIEERPDLRLEPSNLRSMSKQHHDRHTARTRGFARRRQGHGGE